MRGYQPSPDSITPQTTIIMPAHQYQHLTESQIAHFLTHGYVRIPSAIPASVCAAWTSALWPRLGYDPADQTTWLQERINMPSHRRVPAATFSPSAWGAICELLGGEDRVDPECSDWSDGFIVNLGKEEYENIQEVDPKTLDNWHVDGDFFVHFLDSPEQGLLVIPIFSDIEKGGGGTMIAPEGIGMVARWLRDHPEGVSPRMGPLGEERGLEWYIEKIQGCTDFHEMTGKTGDVILLHPLMLHSASKNLTRVPRIITNPKVSLKKPFVFNRANSTEYSLVERKTLKELGVDNLEGWKIAADRQMLVPERVKVHQKMREMEEKRLAGEPVAATAESGSIEREAVNVAVSSTAVDVVS